MNIQDAVKESLKTKRMITRRNIKNRVMFIPTNDVLNRIMIIDSECKRLPGRGWQPDANDLIADDWILTNVNYQNFINDM